MKTLNKILQKQIGKHFGDLDTVPENLHPFLRVISEKYEHDEEERKMLERSIEAGSAEMKLANQQLIYANRVYAFLSKLNQLVITADNEQILFDEACRIAVDSGKFKVAWIGILDVPNKRITLCSQSGLRKDDVSLFADACYADDGPQQHVVSTGSFYLSNDSVNDLKERQWKEFAATRGFSSFAVFPLRKSGQLIGTLNLYAPELDFFNCHEIGLLTEATNNISFALDVFEKEKLRLQAENKLRQSEFRLRQAQEVAHFGNWSLDFATGIARWSDEALRIHGLAPGEHEQTYETWLSFIHPDDLEYVRAVVKESGEKLQNSAIHYRIVRRDGTVRHIFSLTNFEFDNAGKPVGVYGVAHDITDVQVAQQALRQSEMNLRLIMDLIPQAVFAKDYDGRFVFVNKCFGHLYGLDPENMINKTIAEIIPGRNEPAYFLAQDRQIIDTGEMRVIPEMKFVDAKGKERVFHTTKVPYVLPGSNIRAVLGIALDITSIMETKKALRQSQINLRTVVDLIPQSIFAMDGNGKLVFANRRFSELYGRTPKEVVYKKLDELISDKDVVEHFVVQAREVMDSGKMKIIPEMPFTDHAGKKRVFYSMEMPFTPVGSTEPAMLGISLDITEQKEAEAERTKIIADVIQRNKDLEQFSYIVSHNLRSPVANIIGLADLLKLTENEKEEMNLILSHLSDSVKKLDTVIRDLNYILQIKHQVNEKREIVNLPSLVHDIKDSIRNLLNNEEATIISDFSNLAELATLKSYIHSIFFNLISNSIKYRRPDVRPIIRITGTRNDCGVVLTFTDNGLGIDLAEKGEQVFGLYKRFHDHAEGKGMGLYMVRTQVETLGGRITIDSEVNKGTTFQIFFQQELVP